MRTNTITKDQDSEIIKDSVITALTQEKIELTKELEAVSSNAKRAFEKANEDSIKIEALFRKASEEFNLANQTYLHTNDEYLKKYYTFQARNEDKKQAERNKLERTFSVKKQKALMVLILLGLAACCSGVGFIIGLPTLALGIAGFLLIAGSLTSLTLSFAGIGYLDKKLSEDSKLQDTLNENLRLYTQSKTAMQEAKNAFNEAKNLKETAKYNKIRATIVKETTDRQLEMARESLDDVQKSMSVAHEKAGYYSSTAGLLFYRPDSRANKPSDDKCAGAQPPGYAAPG